MKRTVVLAALLSVIAAGISPARAWRPETRIRMLDEAVRLMPASLRLALEKHRRPMLRGLLEPQVDEDKPEHQASWNGGTLEHQIEARAKALIASVEGAAPFDEIARNFGALAHFVMDAGFPPGVSADGGERYAHFAGYCESRREKFPLVFYGHDDPWLEKGDYRGFAREFMTRAREEDANLARVYRLAGDPPDLAHFDDRSVPFAVGSLGYSRTVTGVVRVWMRAWKDSYGDIGRTPYLEKQ